MASRGPEAARERAQLSVWNASIRYHQGRYRDVIRWCSRAVEEAERSGEKNALASAYQHLDYAYVALGQLEQARYSGLALTIYEELGDLQRQATVLNDLGAFAYWQGRWDEATELYERGRELRERMGNPVYAADGTNNIGEILLDQGRLEEATAMFTGALRVFRAASFKSRVAVTNRYLGRVAAYSGRHDEARALLEQAQRAFHEIGARSEVNETESRIAECMLLATESPEALALLEQTLARAERSGGPELPTLRRLRGYALAQSGDLAAARAAFVDALEIARSRGMEFEVALSLDALVRLGESGGTELRAERDAILLHLGVLVVPEIPTGSTPTSRTAVGGSARV